MTSTAFLRPGRAVLHGVVVTLLLWSGLVLGSPVARAATAITGTATTPSGVSPTVDQSVDLTITLTGPAGAFATPVTGTLTWADAADQSITFPAGSATGSDTTVSTSAEITITPVAGGSQAVSLTGLSGYELAATIGSIDVAKLQPTFADVTLSSGQDVWAGGSWPLPSATQTHGALGAAITAGQNSCSVSTGRVDFESAGACTVKLTSQSSDRYLVGTHEVNLTVTPVPLSLDLVLTPASTHVQSTATATVTLTVPTDAPLPSCEDSPVVIERKNGTTWDVLADLNASCARTDTTRTTTFTLPTTAAETSTLRANAAETSGVTTVTPSQPHSFQVAKWATGLDLTPAEASLSYGQDPAGTVTATVTNTSGTGPAPTGTVTFTAVPTAAPTAPPHVLATTTLAGGAATASLAELEAGEWTVTATYQGTSKFAEATDVSTVSIAPGIPTVELTPPTGDEFRIGGTSVWSLTLTGTSAAAHWDTTDHDVCTVTGTNTSGTVTHHTRGECRVIVDVPAVAGQYTAADTSEDDHDRVTIRGRAHELTAVFPSAKVDEPVLLVFRAREGTAPAAGTGTITVTRPGMPSGSGSGLPNSSSTWFGGGKAVEVTPTAAGTYTVTVDFAPSAPGSEYDTTTQTFSLVVGPGTRPVLHTQPTSRMVGAHWTPLSPGTTGTTWDIVDSVPAADGPVCTRAGDTITFQRIGPCTVSFTPGQDPNYVAEPQVVTIEVEGIPVTVTASVRGSRGVGTRLEVDLDLRDATGAPVTPTAADVASLMLCPADAGSCPDDLWGVQVSTWSNGRVTVAGVPLRSGQWRVQLALKPGWSDHWGAPSFSHTVELTSGTPVLDLTNADEVVPDVGSSWPATFTSRSPAPIGVAAGSACRTDPEPINHALAEDGLTWVTTYQVFFAHEGRCELTATQAADAHWTSAVTLTEYLTVQLKGTRVRMSLPKLSERLVDRGNVAEASVKAEALAGEDLSVAGTLRVTALHLESGTSTTAVGEQDANSPVTDDEDPHVAIPVRFPRAGTYLVEVMFLPSDTRYQSSARQMEMTISRRDSTIGHRDPAQRAVTVGATWPAEFWFVPDEIDPPARVTEARQIVVSTTPDVCELNEDGEVVFLEPVDCTVTASAAATDAYHASASVSVRFSVALNPTRVTLPTTLSGTVGEPLDIPVTVDTDDPNTTGDPLAGTVVLMVDSVVQQSTDYVPGASFTWYPERATTPTVLAVTFTPRDTDRYASHTLTRTPSVAKASTATTVRVQGAAAVAEVTSGPRAGTPTGTVTFVSSTRAGIDGTPVTVPLVNGRASTTAHGLGAATDGTVSATYNADDDRSASSSSVERNLPGVTASLTTQGATRNGWYRQPATVTFRCTRTTGELLGGCPAPVRLTKDGKAQRGTATVTTSDGARITATSSPVNIDRTAPTVRIGRVKAGAWYRGAAPTARCEGTDALSGMARCTVVRTPRGKHVVEVTATATDRAGNTATARLRYRVLNEWVAGATWNGTTFVARRGSVIKIVARTSAGVQPQLMLPTRAGAAPSRPGAPMVAVSIEEGVYTWHGRYRVPKSARSGQVLRIGVKDRTRALRIVKVRVK